MLIVQDKEQSESSSPVAKRLSPHVNDTPPPYEPTATSSTLGESGLASASPPFVTRTGLPDVPPTNLAKIRRTNNSIKGKFVIDPGLSVPDEVLSPPEMGYEHDWEYPVAEGPRKNLHLQTVNGSVNAEVWLIDCEEDISRIEQLKRAELEASSKNGSVTLKLHRNTDRPFSLNVSSKNGSVNVSLPQDFVGPLVLSTVNGSISLSKAVEARLVVFSEDFGTRRCFLGDYRSAGYAGKQQWRGSMAEISNVNGGIKLNFLEEITEDKNSSKSSGGFFSRLFGSG